MKIDFFGHEFDVGSEEIKTSFPVSRGDKTLYIVISLVEIGEEDFLGHYACGDILNETSRPMASAECEEEVGFKLTLEIYIETEGQEQLEAGKCVAISCRKHTMVGLLQTLFLAGLVTAYKLD